MQNLTPINQPTITIKNTDLIQEKMDKVVYQVAAKVIAEIMEKTEAKSKEILEKVSALSTPQHVCLNVSVNSAPMTSLSKQASPILGDLIATVKSGLTPMLSGPAGCGKTFVAEQLAEALNLPFDHLCFSSGVSEAWLFGRQLPSGFVEGGFSKMYRNGGVFLADELDAADANMLLAINTALANGHLHNPMTGENITKHENFIFVAACNTLGKGGNAQYTGRNRLDAATLDRFVILECEYEKSIENALCPDKVLANALRAVRKLIKKQGAQEVISYRAFSKLYTLTKIVGKAPCDAMKALTLSFSEELQKEVMKEFSGYVDSNFSI